MSRVQLALNVTNLEAAIGFYSKLFGADPASIERGKQLQGLLNADFFRQVSRLQANSNAVFQLRCLPFRVKSQDAGFASGSRTKAFQDLNRGGRAGAVGPQKTKDLA